MRKAETLFALTAVVLAGSNCAGTRACPSDPSCNPPAETFQKATCNARRFECTGWTLAPDGTLLCPDANLVQREVSGASGCFTSSQTPTQACFSALCAPSSFDYPFNTLAFPGLCTITGATATTSAIGECVPVTAVGNSGDRFDDCLDCTQNGRLCAEGVVLPNGSRICTSLTEYTDNVNARYVDLSQFSGLKSCRNDSLTFPDSQISQANGGRLPIEFPFMQLRSVTANVPQGGNSACGVRTVQAPLTAAYSFPSGSAGSLAMAGQTTAPFTSLAASPQSDSSASTPSSVKPNCRNCVSCSLTLPSRVYREKYANRNDPTADLVRWVNSGRWCAVRGGARYRGHRESSRLRHELIRLDRDAYRVDHTAHRQFRLSRRGPASTRTGR